MDALPKYRTLIITARLSTSALLAGCASSATIVHPGSPAPELGCVSPTSARWVIPDGGVRELRVWIQAVPSANDPGVSITSDLPDEALSLWNRLGLPVRLTRAPSRGRADIRVDVVDRFFSDAGDPSNATRGGVTRLTTTSGANITEAQIMIARHTAAGVRYSDVDLEAILLHELGHAIGLRHSTNPLALMAPQPVVSTVTAADAAVARALYGGVRCNRVIAGREDGAGSP